MELRNEIPWAVIVMVFIGFVSWVYNRFQEVAAERRQRRLNEVKKQYREDPNKVPQAPTERPKSALEQMVEAVTGNVEEIRRQQELDQQKQIAEKRRRQAAIRERQQQQEAQRQGAPPPLPQNQRKQREPEIVVPQPKSNKTLAPPTSGPLATSIGDAGKSKSGRKKRRVEGIRSVLRGQDSLRQVLIASEILQKPKALEE